MPCPPGSKGSRRLAFPRHSDAGHERYGFPSASFVVSTDGHHHRLPSFALEGYELEMLDYLVKPITFQRFLKAALKGPAAISPSYKETGR